MHGVAVSHFVFGKHAAGEKTHGKRTPEFCEGAESARPGGLSSPGPVKADLCRRGL